MRLEDQILNAAIGIQGHGNLLVAEGENIAYGKMKPTTLDFINSRLNLLKRDIAFMELAVESIRQQQS